MKSESMIVEKFGSPLEKRDILLPSLKEGEALIKIDACGICNLDVHIWQGRENSAVLPLVLGHEGLGRVVDIKGEKKCADGGELKEGDMVIWNKEVECGKCYFCTEEKKPELCPWKLMYGLTLHGGYSEYAVLAKNTSILKIDKIDPFLSIGATCAGSTIAHAFELCPPQKNDIVLVIGPGPFGIFAVSFAVKYNASQIIVIGSSKKRLEFCQKAGSTTIVNRNFADKEERKKIINELTGGKGVDWVIETVGTLEALHEAIDLARVGGTCLSLGFETSMGKFSFDPYEELVKKNLRLQGVWLSNVRHTQKALELMSENQDVFKDFITDKYSLKDATSALSNIQGDNVIKSILVP